MPQAAIKKPRQFRYHGDLSETPLPEILARVAHFDVPGRLEAMKDDKSTEIFVRAGHVIHARSSDLGNSLGVYLRRIGRLSQDEFRRVMRLRRESSVRLGGLLIEHGLMTPAEVRDAIVRQTEEIVWSLFSWWRGSVTFKLGPWDPVDMPPIHLSLSRVIIDGIKRESDARPLIARIGGRDTVLEPCFTIENTVEHGLDADDYALLTMIDSERTLFELCSDGPRIGKDNARMLYAFCVLGLVRPIRPKGDVEDPKPTKLTAFRHSNES